MIDKEEILLVLVTNKWFECDEVIYAERSGRDYVTTRVSRKCRMGYFINSDIVKKITKEDYPEYWLWMTEKNY